MNHPLTIDQDGNVFDASQPGRISGGTLKQALDKLVKYAKILEENEPDLTLQELRKKMLALP